MRRGWLAVDAGGSRTRALIVTEDGCRGTGEAGPANWTTLGPAPCVEAIARATDLALGEADVRSVALNGACVALAGFYPPWHDAEVQSALGPAVPGVSLQVVPDLVAAWTGATGGNAGIVLVAGTGAVAYGRDASGRSARAGGWGPLFGDEGGGYWIGCEALRAISHSLDGRGPSTSLRGALEGASGAEEALRGVYRDAWARERVAGLCEVVARHAAAGDGAAEAIMRRAAAELGALVAEAARGLGWGAGPLPVSALGGVILAGSVLLDPLESWLAIALPNARWTPARGNSLDGALWLAREGRLP